MVAGLIAVSTPAQAADLVVNPDVEEGGADPFCWSEAGWGDNEDTLDVSTDARSGSRSLSIEMTSRASGDRKWLVTENDDCAPVVVPGNQYEIAVWIKSTSPANSLTVFRRTATSWLYWVDLAASGATAGEWVEMVGTTPAVPTGTERVAFGVSLSAPGVLLTDDYSLSEVGATATPTVTSPTVTSPTVTSPTVTSPTTSAPPDPDGSLVVNGALEEGEPVPSCFQFVGWGDGAVDGGLVDGVTGRGWRQSLAGRTEGDWKLMISESPTCAPAVEEGRTYDLSVTYRSTASAAALTLFRQTAAGWEYWTDVRGLPAVDGWTPVRAVTPEVPPGTARLSVGVSIAGDGDVLVDDVAMTPVADPDDPAPTVTATPSTAPTTPPTGGESEIGRWTVAEYALPSRTIHSTVLVDGRVLLIAGSGNDLGQFQAGTFSAEVLDPATGEFTPLAVPEDMFCAGHVTLADGRVLVMGGTADYPTDPTDINYPGIPDSWIFTPGPDTFTAVNDAQTGHWYPTLTRLASGDVWAAGGLKEDRTGTVNTEMFDVAAERWLGLGEVPQTWSFWGLYPHMILLEDGRLFYSGVHTFGDGLPGTGASLYDWQTGAIQDVPGLRNKDMRDQGASVLLPPAQDQRVAVIGGGNVTKGDAAISDVDLIDLRDPAPAYTPGPDLPGPGKMYVNAVILPDRTVFTTGGATHNRINPVLTAAAFDPVTGTWSSRAPDPVARQYHSSAFLLPDGRVMAVGSNPGDGSFEHRVSFYEPPYLFRGPRPVVGDVPAEIALGATVEISAAADGTAGIQHVDLVSPMSVTHQTDPNMRLVDVPFVEVSPGRLRLTLPGDPDLLVPGPYMLTVTDTDGVPSVAEWVSVG